MIEAPLNYLFGAGERAYPVVSLTWGMMAISVAVIVAIGVLLIWGTFRHADEDRDATPDRHDVTTAPIARPRAGLEWIYVGVGISTVALLFSAVWTMYTMAEVHAPGVDPAVTIEITGHQWWWEGRYRNDDPSQIFTTANEFHIPVGEPVRFVLGSGDVIHSFWVPALFGKTDAIPGQVNRTWFQADEPGVYRGQCTEYCGAQHAKMGFTVVAQKPEAFEAWRKHQLAFAEEPPEDTAAARGEAIFMASCAGCHRVRGTVAGGALGPDLTHVASRGMIAAGALDNTKANLAGWIADPQHIKPGSRMPAMELSGPELNAVVSYVAGLE